MMQLDFSGWFQCRLATDPDPSDEPRGVSGWTYALPGEPDLDRIIRTRPEGTTPRQFGPEIGVSINRVRIDGREAQGHPLSGAPFKLLSDPVFEGRNGIASEDTEEPIFPFHLSIEIPGLRLEREFRKLDSFEWRFEKSAGTEANFEAMTMAGIDDPAEHIETRTKRLQERVADTSSVLEKLQLETRLRHLDQRKFGPVPMFVGLRYRYSLEGPWCTVIDERNALKGVVESSPWLFSGWVGCWDADALCGFMNGELLLPFRADRSQA